MNIHRRTLTLFMLVAGLLNAHQLFSQTDSLGTIRGLVLADSTTIPLEFVNILLLRKADSSLVMGSSTDAEGNFVLRNVPDGEYFLKYNLVGYSQQTTSPFVIGGQHRRLTVGTMKLSQTSVNLNEVDIRADRSPFVSSIDKMVYDVGQDISSKAASAGDLLENIPSVQVDLNGEVSLRGSKRVLLMINGMRSPLLERQEGTFLEELPAEAIEKIEVITTPSARYRAEGKSGIINIILKKETRLGVQGNFISHVSNDGRYNGTVRLNVSPGNFNVYGSYSVHKINRNRLNSDIRYEATSANPDVVSSVYLDTLYAYAKPLTHSVMLGFDYKVDSLNGFGVSGNFLRNSFLRTDSSYRLLKNANGAVLSEYVRNDEGEEIDDEYGATLSYYHDFSRKDHKLSFEAAASRSPETDEYHFTNTYISPPFPSTRDNSLIGQRDDRSHLAVSYSNVINKNTALEAGYFGELNRTDLNYIAESYDLVANEFVQDPVKSSRYRYDESIHSLYATYKQTLGKLELLGGIRYERASGTSDLEKSDSTISSTYANLFPSLHLSYKTGKFNEVRLSYSRRISRPKARDLNPYAEYRDPKNISYGNPELVPEYIHSIELAYQYQRSGLYLLPSIFYRSASNDISPIKRLVNRSTLQTTKYNVASDQALGIELICSVHPSEVLSARLSTTGLYDRLDASNVGGGQYTSNVSWSGTLTTNLTVAKDSRVELHTHWSSLRKTPQGERFPNTVVNLGYKQGFLEGKLSLTATISDLFKTSRRHDELEIPRLQQVIFNTRESRAIFLGVTYRFGSTPKKGKDEEFRDDDDE